MADETRSPEKPTDQWVTGDEPMTGPQESYLHTLAREAGEDVPDGLTKAQASEMIDRLQAKTGRGTDSSGGGSGAAGSSTAERAGIVDQQDAVLEQMDQAPSSTDRTS